MSGGFAEPTSLDPLLKNSTDKSVFSVYLGSGAAFPVAITLQLLSNPRRLRKCRLGGKPWDVRLAAYDLVRAAS